MDKFAKGQLEKHGWKQGQGLGKNEHGIKEAIRVKIKNDTRGVGHDPGEQFTYHWWDHVFNKAANSINVKATENGVDVSRSGDLHVSTKKPFAKTYADKAMLYGRFIKAATLQGSEEILEDVGTVSSEEEEETTPKICTDEDMLRACGGRTAHKAARHGHKLNGKLLRIQQQEAMILLTPSSGNTPNHSEDSQDTDTTESRNNADNADFKKKHKKSKKKKRDKLEGEVSELCSIQPDFAGTGSVECIQIKEKKKKKKKTQDKVEMKEESHSNGNLSVDLEVKEQNDSDCDVNGNKTSKKRKSKLAGKTESEEENPCASNCDEVLQVKKFRKSKKSKRNLDQDHDSVDVQATDLCASNDNPSLEEDQQGKTKKKKSKNKRTKDELEKVTDSGETQEVLEPVKKKKKKSKGDK